AGARGAPLETLCSHARCRIVRRTVYIFQMDSNGNAGPADCDGARMRPRMRVMNATASKLGRAIEAMCIPGILVDHRPIADGDELALMPAELAAFAGSVLK